MELQFQIDGIAQTQGSKRAFPFKRRDGRLGVAVSDDNPKGKAWKSQVTDAATEALFLSQQVLTTGPIMLEVDFYLPRPKAHYGSGRNRDTLKPNAPIFHTQKPDATKLLRAVEDALKGVVWSDDSQVCDSHPRKFWARTAFVVVTIRTIDTQADIERHFGGCRHAAAVLAEAVL